MGTLERMRSWKVVDESTIPPDAELIDPKWVLKLKFENDKYVKHKEQVVAKGYLQKRTPDFRSFSTTTSQVSGGGCARNQFLHSLLTVITSSWSGFFFFVAWMNHIFMFASSPLRYHSDLRRFPRGYCHRTPVCRKHQDAWF